MPSHASAPDIEASPGLGFTALAPYALLTATLSLGYGSVFTLLNEFRSEFGFTEGGLGLIAAAGFYASFIAQVSLARYADRGHSALMVRAGMISAVASMLWMSVADELWQFIVARLLFGAGTGAVAPAIRRVIITRDPERLGENLGRLTAFDIGGFVLGPLLAAVLAEVIGLRAPFVLLAVAYATLALLSARLDLRSVAGEKSMLGVRSLLRRRSVLAVLAATVGFYTTIGFFEAVWSVFLDDLGSPTWYIGLTLSLFTIPMIPLAPIGGRLAQARGPMLTARFGITVATLCTVGYAIIGTAITDGNDAQVALLLAAAVVAGVHAIGDSFTMPSLPVGMAVSAPEDQAAAAQGLVGAVGLVVAGTAAWTGGAMYQAGGAPLVFSVCAIVMLVALGTAQLLGGKLRSGLDSPDSAM